MPQPVPTRRIIGAMVAAALLVGAVHFALEYRRMDRAFYEWLAARPLNASVDLSRPGKISVPFRQTCQVAHGEQFYVTIGPDEARDSSTPLRGLSGTITITDGEGNEVQSLELTPRVDAEPDADGALMLAYFRPFANGDYTATIDVHSGAAALEGTEQTLYATYVLCGLERFPALITGFLALACGISGLLMGTIVTKGFLELGLSPPPQSIVK